MLGVGRAAVGTVAHMADGKRMPPNSHCLRLVRPCTMRVQFDARWRTDRAQRPAYLAAVFRPSNSCSKGHLMNSIIYIVGFVVILFAILGFLGLR